MGKNTSFINITKITESSRKLRNCNYFTCNVKIQRESESERQREREREKTKIKKTVFHSSVVADVFILKTSHVWKAF